MNATTELCYRGRSNGIEVGMQQRMLLMESLGSTYAIPLEHAIEVLRPLPVNAVPGMPPFVEGLSMVRGLVTPVLSLAQLVNPVPNERAARWVLARLAGRKRLAIGVRSVPGIFELSVADFGAMPSLVDSSQRGYIDRIGSLDNQVLFVLRAVRLLPGDMLDTLLEGRAS